MECKLQRIGHIAVVYNDQLLIWGGYKVSPSMTFLQIGVIIHVFYRRVGITTMSHHLNIMIPKTYLYTTQLQAHGN